MINYILFFLIPPLLIYRFSKSNTYRIFSWILVFFFLLFLSTFRDQIGSDQGDYQLTFSKQFYNFDPKDFPTYELLYSYIEWFSYKLKLGFHGVNFMCGLIYLFGLIILIKDEKRSWLCLLISLPYFYFAVSWGFLRQGLSLGFIFMAVYFYKNNKIFSSIVTSVLSVLSHKFSIIFFPFLFFSYVKNKSIKIIIICSGIIILLFLSYYSIYINKTYIEQFITNIPKEYISKGSLLRSTMSLVPSVIFLLSREYMKKYSDYNLYFFISILCILLFILTFLFPIPVMRIGVYFGFIQFIILPRFVDIIDIKFQTATILFIVISYSFIFISWLLYSPHKDLWLPFKLSF